ncbi:prolipoprotein diacylglyceryl transferase [Ectothiorhodospiraceae bacterium BW-2]|nr:prolipoprotein diacylglyceryl transferase [Ectothiorhodospiraceae bacterium BW-2]
MLNYPNIDPVALDLGAVKIHWYGVMYLIGFAAAWWLGRLRAASYQWSHKEVEDLIFFGALGVILGGRVGYLLFYNFDALVDNPLTLFKIWQGGMSFHGGLLGVMAALWFLARKNGRCYFCVIDFVAPLVPLGLAAGRLGNFINAELWGRTTELPWGMIFPGAGPLPRHPSMLYEFLLEGVVLFIILWWFSAKPRPVMAVSGLFALGYGTFRFMVEFVREPDAHIGYLAGEWLTMGMVLSLPLIAIGIGLLWLAYRRHPRELLHG